MNYKKFAKNLVKAMNHEKAVVMRDEDYYYVTDTHIAVKMDELTYSHFRQAFAKYSIVPELEKEECIKYNSTKPSCWEEYNGFINSFKSVMQWENIVPGTFAKLVYALEIKDCKACNFAYSDNKVVAIDKKYGDLIKDFQSIELSKDGRLVYATQEDLLVVMCPFYLGSDYVEEIIRDAKQIATILEEDMKLYLQDI